MSFFDDFNEARHQFTIGDAKKPELNVLQVGLVGVFFIDKGHQRREAIAQALELYAQRYGDKLKWGYFGENMKKRNWDAGMLTQCLDYIQSESPMEYVNFLWSSSAVGFGYVGDYAIDAVSPAGWFEEVHKTLSYVRFYLPIEELQGNVTELETSFLIRLCDLLRPIHGYFGLGLQNCYEHEDYQHMEYELAEEFRAVDVGHPLGRKELRAGFKTVNWYTILDQQLVDKLGGADAIRTQLPDERIALMPYSHGIVIRAGDWPELGWVKKNPYPELYVKVNQALQPVRAPELQSLHYGSIAGEIRFNPRTSNEWLRRFDNPPPPPTERPRPKLVKTATDVLSGPRLRCPAGDACPRHGYWFTPSKADSRRLFKAGEFMPRFESDYGEVIWQWDEAQ
jgi:hypothetical protein